MKILVTVFLLGLVAAESDAATGVGEIWLVKGGKVCCAILRGDEDEYAAERMNRWLKDVAGVQAPVFTEETSLGDVPCVMSIGSAGSNPFSARLATAEGVDIAPGQLTDQGYVARRCRDGARECVILAGGGPDGTRYAVADLINWRLEHDTSGVRLGYLDAREIPRYKYRWFWNWDHRMDWGGPGTVGTLMGGGGTFSKQPEAFLIDFKRCVDYMADHKFNGLIIWGFLRDTHGGVEASQELCQYAARRGVRILPGVGTSGYAGYYFEGNHPYNADTWLATHPELRALDEDGKPKNVPCPSKKANQDWLDEGAEWLFDTFDIGGVNLEMGDFFVCYCDDCKKARAAILSDEPDYYKDMAISHSVTFRKMRTLSDEAWLSYATYTGYTAEMMTTPPRFLDIIPDDAICQWTLTGMARTWPAEVRPMARHNIGYLHWCNRSTHTEDDFYLGQIRDICRNAASAGFEGLDTYGELSSETLNAELFYLAWEAFLWNPDMTIETFVAERLSPLYGGAEPARALLDIVPLVDTAKQRANPDNFVRALEIAHAAREEAEPNGVARWYKMIAYLERHEAAARKVIEAQRRREEDARKGKKIAVASVKASDEDAQNGWPAANAIDGNVDEPAGYWLTRSTHPERAWIELALAEPAAINRIVLFHQLNPGHYRSLDYTVSLRVAGAWQRVVSVKDNAEAGWVAHTIDTVVADAARLDIVRSAHSNRMGVGEIELRMVADTR
ncbi:MAG TPA: discoidin domain-containing protein [Candidatus Hydrogenedentes bacterium]|nr:discoidin domain-containing protein [Candidatus Hydrogenedentota bacterium]HPG69686.1 discoidin domain-containing protein [Candidatus Hydrogenedentota bacterium]